LAGAGTGVEEAPKRGVLSDDGTTKPMSSMCSISGEVEGGPGGVRRLGLPGTKVIRGFRVNDGLDPNADSNRHIRELGIMTNPDNIEIYNSDDSPGDDDWEYVVRYAALN
jgi:hypothetical protein